METAKHTPTPWDRKNTGSPTGNPGHLIFAEAKKIARLVTLDEENYANAEYIVQAANAHDTLVDLVRKAYDRFTDNDMRPANHALAVWLADAEKVLAEPQAQQDHAATVRKMEEQQK